MLIASLTCPAHALFHSRYQQACGSPSSFESQALADKTNRVIAFLAEWMANRSHSAFKINRSDIERCRNSSLTKRSIWTIRAFATRSRIRACALFLIWLSRWKVHDSHPIVGLITSQRTHSFTKNLDETDSSEKAERSASRTSR